MTAPLMTVTVQETFKVCFVFIEIRLRKLVDEREKMIEQVRSLGLTDDVTGL